MSTNENQRQLVTTARVTGIWYLMMAVSGMVGFVILHPQVFVSGEPERALANVTDPATVGEFWMIGYLLIYGIRPSNHPE
ncbi:hypothetical protein [Cyclobacterium roseum]|uniref:hypothetical protein n=1 Tax=Cyclobacterium roseum TaxID=2666137 RepID=UPI00139195F2|nr:hypothetical protein [Cyclobacterium roseum]